MHGVTPVGGAHLHIAAFDLARGPSGQWAVMSQRTQAPSGLGYLLENRLLISRQFPQAFEAMRIQRLAASYRDWLSSLKQHTPQGPDAHVALLTPGPYNETYFEHAYLARYLGLTLVEGNDLTVRDERLYLRTLRGLEPVHVLLKRMDDEYLDPLELRADSTLGIPGLLQTVRAAHVLVANTPGSAFLESPALLGFLPAISEALLGEVLKLPSLNTWWCGEKAALNAVLPDLAQMVIKPTYPERGGDFNATLCGTLHQAQRDEWSARLTREPSRYTVQTYQPLSQMPTWAHAEKSLQPRSVVLRVFALRNGPGSWSVLPGGLARIAPRDAGIASMQRGGSSADVWVESDTEVDHSSLLGRRGAPGSPGRLVTSRAAENLYWLGRYTERSENSVRLTRLCLKVLNGEDFASFRLWNWLQQLCVQQNLVPASTPPTQAMPPVLKNHDMQRHRVFERSLISNLMQSEHTTSVGFNLRALQQTASTLRERLSTEHWHAIQQCVEQFTQNCLPLNGQPHNSAVLAIQALDAASHALAGITGSQTDRMTRDEGWQLLSIGRHVERLGFLASALNLALQTGALTTDDPHHDSTTPFNAVLALFDSTITFHARYQESRDIESLLELLVMDTNNPRALTWVSRSLRSRLKKLAQAPSDETNALAQLVPDVQQWTLDQLVQQDDSGQLSKLRECLQDCTEAAWQISDAISAQYFNHTDQANPIGA